MQLHENQDGLLLTIVGFNNKGGESKMDKNQTKKNVGAAIVMALLAYFVPQTESIFIDDGIFSIIKILIVVLGVFLVEYMRRK